MRVLHTVDSVRSEAGGPSQSVPSLVRSLQGAGVEASLWTGDPEGARDLHPDVASPVGSLGQVIERMGRVDVIHDHGIWLRSNHQSAFLATSLGIARVVSPRGMLEPHARQLRAWKKRVAWMLYQRKDLRTATFLHATSDREKLEFPRLGLNQPAIVIPNGVDLPAYRSLIPSSARRDGPVPGADPSDHGRLPALIDAWGRVAPEGWRMRVGAGRGSAPGRVGITGGGGRSERCLAVRRGCRPRG